MRVDDDPPTYFAEKLTYSISVAIDRYYRDVAGPPSLDDRAQVLRAVWKYVISLGVREENLPDVETLVGMVKLTGGILGVPAPKGRRVG